MKKFCLALDLVDDPKLIAEYEHWHQSVWPGIIQRIRASGIDELQIYRFGNRLVMLIEAADSFKFEEKARMDADDPMVQEWEALMWKYQQPVPGAAPGEKWIIMNKIFDLNS